IIQFKKDFPKTKQVSLIKNYRSCQNILDLAYKFIKLNDPDRLEFVNKISKKLTAEDKCSGAIEHIHAKTLEEEVSKTIKKVSEIFRRDKSADYNDFAILVRANDAASPFIKALERAGLPYQFLAKRGLYSKPVVLDVISYFKLLDNYHESPAVWRILNMPFLEIPPQDVMKLMHYSHKKAKSLYEAVVDLPLIPEVSLIAREKITFVLRQVQKHSFLAKEKAVSEIFVAFLEDSGYLKYLVGNDDKAQLDLLDQFYKRVKAFEDTTIEPTLYNFMREINLEIDSGEEGKLEFDPELGPEMIKVMTIHGAKGLEFKYVFLANMVDKRFPTQERKDLIELPEDLIKDIKPKGDVHLQEERRLCYVAMTRAKRELYFTSAENYGGARKKKLSRFMMEMGYQDKVAGSKVSSNGLLEKQEKHLNRAPAIKYKLPGHFSYSQLAAFDKCPLQYKFAFILRVPTRGKAVFSFGKTMHATLHDFLKLANEGAAKNQSDLFGFTTKTPVAEPRRARFATGQAPITFKTLSDIYDRCWIDEWYESKKQKEDYYQLGKEIIKEFYKEFEKNQPKVLKIDDNLALEMPFNLKIGEHTLFGVIDRIDEKDGGVAIFDYKTGTSKDKLDAEAKEQLLIYQIAAEEIFKLEPRELIYHYLNKNKKVSFLGSEKEKAALKEKIIQEIEEIKTSDFKPAPGWQCAYCDFLDVCDWAKR
ncbi:MAG: ATP-dependent DNA helicase, partial [Patescibacteria group bacterium]